ncbi:hypothetical protein [Erythrobacter sp. JK5]|uniref:hypothetical protein n=1 Tax=Erythrobacter sp. JK5 TaxID=2829500 RepID=UPI001BA4B1DB|nr:hypothetical protein [Erythrobacter sp. JK5]QUL36642.1 hypothetical protein KDC96_09355 [Erythrobacter sp. JK5]
MIGTGETRRRGGPIAVLGLLMAVWIGGRTLMWESPFAAMPLELGPDAILLAAADDPIAGDRASTAEILPDAQAADPPFGRTVHASPALRPLLARSSRSPAFAAASPFSVHPRIAAGHRLLWLAALGNMPMPRAVEDALSSGGGALVAGSGNPYPPYAQPLATADRRGASAGRWSLDTWAFWRQGSNAAPVSQGRVPIYGASQIGASLQFRLAPASRRDPALYARAYRALVEKGETELAAGIALRPVGRLPLRARAELRIAENAAGTELRPAAYLVTELPPAKLPGGIVGEAYVQGGYVGGNAATPFADGQIALTREVARFDLAATRPARLSVGAGAWGGAQQDASRLDLGPTVRFDLSVGTVPARLSVDWRERVAGDAAPASGVAATLSTRF